MKRILSITLVIMLLIGIVPATPTQAATATITYISEAVYNSIGIYSEGLVWVKQGDN